MLPVNNGAALGAPLLIRYGDFENAYTAAAGALVYQAASPGGIAAVFLASFDADGQLGSWRRLTLRGGGGRPEYNPTPSFSPDGTRIAYVARDADPAGGGDLVLLDLSTGQERVVYRGGRGLRCQYATRSSNVFCTEPKTNGETDVVSLDVISGEVKQLGSLRGTIWLHQVSHDDGALYFEKWADKADIPIVRWEMATHQEILLGVRHISGPEDVVFPSLDDQWLVRESGQGLAARLMSGGEWKQLASCQGTDCGTYVTTRDGNWVLYHSTDTAGRHSLFRVPITGGQPQRLGDFPSQAFQGYLYNISADARQILAVAFDSSFDLWVLDNFVPRTKQ